MFFGIVVSMYFFEMSGINCHIFTPNFKVQTLPL